MGIASINPTTGQVLQTFEALSPAELEQRLQLAYATTTTYRQTSVEQRAVWLNQAAALLEARKGDYGRLITLEMGKPIGAAIAEVDKCAWVCRFYAEQAAEFLADQAIATEASHSFVRYQPLGVILAVMPWNYPFWQVFRFAAPALMAGNVGLLKPASNVPQVSLAIADLFDEAGFPKGTFQTLLIEASRIAALVQDPRIAAATLTGSEGAGQSLAAHAGQALKKTVLELGGSDPFIVMPSADLEAAAAAGTASRLLSNGQTCISAKRFILHEAIAPEFTAKLTQRFQAQVIGDPLDPQTTLGPLATAAILHEVAHQVELALEQGATLVTGGRVLAGTEALPANLRQGHFYEPTILRDLPPDAPMSQEEIFGPVALVFIVRNLEEAIALANGTPFGLGASAWTTDPSEQARFTQELDAGAVFINSLTKSDPRLPFGGIKRSGYGRELSAEGLREFVNIKSVWIQ